MTRLSSETLAWAAEVLGGDVTVVRGLREGGSPWLIQTASTTAVLRVATDVHADNVKTEVAAMQHAAKTGLPAPKLLGHRYASQAGPALVLTTHVVGSSQIPMTSDTERLRMLGAIAARISAVEVPSVPELPLRTGPIGDMDWVALRQKHGASEILQKAEKAISRFKPASEEVVFVHGDLWHGNTLWDGSALTAILDWDASGIGSPGIDLGSFRLDAALCYGLAEAQHVLAGWEEEAGRCARDIAYWDIVAALATPPEMSWVLPAMVDQGRSDLNAEILTKRREDFIVQALAQLELRAL